MKSAINELQRSVPPWIPLSTPCPRYRQHSVAMKLLFCKLVGDGASSGLSHSTRAAQHSGDSRNKKGGGHCGAKENVGGATKMSILHGDFSLL